MLYLTMIVFVLVVLFVIPFILRDTCCWLDKTQFVEALNKVAILLRLNVWLFSPTFQIFGVILLFVLIYLIV